MKFFIELLHGEIPLKKNIESVDNRGKGIASTGVPNWAQVYAPIFNENDNFSTVGRIKLVGRIYCEKKGFLDKLGKKRLTRAMLDTPEATAIFEDALKNALKK
jgi:hypothetical protein